MTLSNCLYSNEEIADEAIVLPLSPCHFFAASCLSLENGVRPDLPGFETQAQYVFR